MTNRKQTRTRRTESNSDYINCGWNGISRCDRGWQLDYNCNELKPKHLGGPESDFSWSHNLKWETHPESDHLRSEDPS